MVTVMIAVLAVGSVDIDGLVLTESGGNPRASGDKGKSLGLCQIKEEAWKDVLEWCSVKKYSYRTYCYDPVINRLIAHGYINDVLPNKYFKVYRIPDSTHMRIAAYKYGVGMMLQLWRQHGKKWEQFVPDTVKRDLKKYDAFVRAK